MLRIISFLLMASGGIFMIFTAFKYNKLFNDIKKDSLDMPSYSTVVINAIRLMLAFFITGFIFGAVNILLNTAPQAYYFIGLVFFVASLFTFLLVNNLYMLSKSVNSKNHELKEAYKQIEMQNSQLQSEVESRVEKIIQQDKLLRTVNDMGSILLASGIEEFNDAMFRCMKMLAQSVDVDRTYIWENYWKNGELYCTQLFEWSGGAEPQQGNELTVDVGFPEDWHERLSNNKCVNGIVSTFPKREKEHLEAQGIVSILVVPVFLKNRFWGFVGFDDCHNERTFSEAEEGILRSASLLIATSLLRNEITQSLIKAREEALYSTKAKTNFLSNMSHEIRTPINAITGMTTIARNSQDHEKIIDCLDKIDSASYQLLGLINDILDVSKIEAGKMELANEPFDLYEALKNIKNMLDTQTNAKSQTFLLTIDKNVPRVVIGDDLRLSQIFINLLSNAVKFTDEHGKITFDIKLESKNEDKYLFEAVVCDNGIGISPQQQQRLFKAFEQAEINTARNYGGTGLGLTISKNIAKMMDGDIFVKSRPGEGSCFIVRFQLKAGNEEMLYGKENDQTQNEEPADMDFSKYTVLLVEDIEINREIVIAMLKPTGVSIECAQNGEAALNLFQKDPAKYDLIFMDIQMPVMDGYQATEAIRSLDNEKAKKVPIIAMTANAYKEDVEKALSSGMNEHLSKPININSVMKVLTKYLS